MACYSVLLVDDEELALAGLENGVDWKAIEIEKVYKADSMKSAREAIQKYPVDIMVSDIEMPAGSGLELIRWVKENYPEIVCIFYTCHAEFSYCQDAIRLGAMDYILKPIPYHELEQIIQKGLCSVQKQRETKNLENIWGELTKKPEEDSPVELVKRLITENINVEISRDELAKAVYMSPDY
ncbi:MAG: response regulator, partial [Ruminococcus flavefaciens]|nr:response regulator [Ruminococcus flavefaciens]